MNIQFEQTVTANNDEEVNVVVSVQGKKVVAMIDDIEFNIKPTEVEDVEYLAEVFKYEQVCVFAVLVKLLGKVQRAKELL